MTSCRQLDGMSSTLNPGFPSEKSYSIFQNFDKNISRLESVVYPLFTEPTHMVVFDIAFKRETYFDGSFGVLVKVSNIC